MNRIELSINSKYSGNSLVDIEELINKANELHLEGIAITDFNDVNSFFELNRIIKNYPNLKIIYGTKIKVKYNDLLIKLDILVRNKHGLKNLYKILTLNNTKKTNINIYKLFDYSNDLLIGLNVTNDNIYELLKNHDDKYIYEFIKVFDYLIINPSINHDYIKKIVEIAKKYHKLIISSSDVRYLNKEDKKYYEIFKGKEISSNNHLMSANEMLQAFSYLSKIDKQKIVIDDSQTINSLIDKYIPLTEEIKYHSENENIIKLKNKVYKKANELYKHQIPKDIQIRIETELSLINEVNAYNLLINSNLVSLSENMGYVTFTRGAICSSYINYLLGITKINPLEYDLDYKDFYGNNKNDILRLAINYDERIVKKLYYYLCKEFRKANIIRCGTLGYISETTIKEKIKHYEKQHNIKFSNKDIEMIINKLSKIKRINGKLPGTYLCLPKHFNGNDFSPLTKLNDLTTMIDYHKIQDNILKITILSNSYNKIYDDLTKETNIQNINLNDHKVWDFITSINNIGILNENNLQEAIQENKPTNIKQLAIIWQNIHKTKDWIPSLAQSIEYATMYYKLIYIKYYFIDIFDKIVQK